jgi:type IV secretory pathway TrbL component
MIRRLYNKSRRSIALALVVLLNSIPAMAGLTIIGSNGITASGADSIDYYGTNGITASGADGILAFGPNGIAASGAARTVSRPVAPTA